MRDSDTILLENIYTNQILLNEAAPRQRNYIQGAWDRLAGEPLDHSTSIARNQLIDMYRKVWKSFEDDWESNNAIARNPPIPITLDYLADFIHRKYSQIDVSKIVDPLALEYAPNGNFNDELEQQTIGDFLYDTLADYYESVGGLDQGTGDLEIPKPQTTQQPNQQPNQQPTPQPIQSPNPQPTPQPTKKKYKLPYSNTRINYNKKREDDKENPKTLKGKLGKYFKNVGADMAARGKAAKTQIRHT